MPYSRCIIQEGKYEVKSALPGITLTTWLRWYLPDLPTTDVFLHCI